MEIGHFGFKEFFPLRRQGFPNCSKGKESREKP